MPEDEPIYEEIDDLLVLMDEICSEGEPDNLQPVCNAISKVKFTPFLAMKQSVFQVLIGSLCDQSLRCALNG